MPRHWQAGSPPLRFWRRRRLGLLLGQEEDSFSCRASSYYFSPIGTFSTRMGKVTEAPTPLTANASENGGLGLPATTTSQDRSSAPPMSDWTSVVGHGRPSTSKTWISTRAALPPSVWSESIVMPLSIIADWTRSDKPSSV